jgi:diguanylate cyclase (GGDEF)-like protein
VFSSDDGTEVTAVTTGAFIPRYFAEWFASAVAEQARLRSPVSVLRFDVDDFEQINGAVGNAVLRIVGASVRRIINPKDVLARGDGAFAVFARGISERNAAILAERIRRTVNGLPLVAEGKAFHVSVSVGVAWAPGTDPEQVSVLLDSAELAVCRARSSGKNRVNTVIVD